MNRPMHRRFLCMTLVVVLLGVTLPVRAAEFPSRPITLICPWSAGGSTDVFLRVLAQITAKHLGQPVIVENKPGGAGTVGPATMAAMAKPDGYTLSQSPIAIFRLPHMMKVTWDPLKDFSYIIQLTGYPMGLVVRADAPWKTFNEFIAYAKANPDKITYAAQAGSTPHISIERVALQEGIKWRNVPGKGDAETTAAVLGGHVNAGSDSTGWGPQVDAGELRLLVTYGNQRTKRWPNVPTLKELGYNIVSNSPFGIAGPRGLDPKVVQILHDAFKKGMEDPACQSIMDKFDMEPFYKNTQDYIRYTYQLYEEEKVVEKIGLKKK